MEINDLGQKHNEGDNQDNHPQDVYQRLLKNKVIHIGWNNVGNLNNISPVTVPTIRQKIDDELEEIKWLSDKDKDKASKELFLFYSIKKGDIVVLKAQCRGSEVREYKAVVKVVGPYCYDSIFSPQISGEVDRRVSEGDLLRAHHHLHKAIWLEEKKENGIWVSSNGIEDKNSKIIEKITECCDSIQMPEGLWALVRYEPKSGKQMILDQMDW